MKGTARTILVVVRADPRVSDRAGEALRMCVGLAGGGHRVRLMLPGPAAALAEPERYAFPEAAAVRTRLDTLADLSGEILRDADLLHEARRADVVIQWGA